VGVLVNTIMNIGECLSAPQGDRAHVLIYLIKHHCTKRYFCVTLIYHVAFRNKLCHIIRPWARFHPNHCFCRFNRILIINVNSETTRYFIFRNISLLLKFCRTFKCYVEIWPEKYS
jgi:hypothetical protein